ncbi:hypothetical protein TorRG33x02_206800 [Trema orientale]|uniref:Uncharacterized protein n=1 Tax=Trema orientale TaxID=63057 RepID=A0A2P5EDB9_TREOI|nr:hypothetical protein TorRG33x02_206800 [Trema orientale]
MYINICTYDFFLEKEAPLRAFELKLTFFYNEFLGLVKDNVQQRGQKFLTNPKKIIIEKSSIKVIFVEQINNCGTTNHIIEVVVHITGRKKNTHQSAVIATVKKWCSHLFIPPLKF